MKTWQFVLVGLAALAIAGCQADPNVAMLEQRNRRLEDEIYRLRDQLDDCQAGLQAAQRCRAAPRQPTRRPSAKQRQVGARYRRPDPKSL